MNIWTAPRVKGSQFWNSLQKIIPIFKARAKFEVRNGKSIFFWYDCWLDRAQSKIGSHTDLWATVAEAKVEQALNL